MNQQDGELDPALLPAWMGQSPLGSNRLEAKSEAAESHLSEERPGTPLSSFQTFGTDLDSQAEGELDRSQLPAWMTRPGLAQPVSVEALPPPQLQSPSVPKSSRAAPSMPETEEQAGPSDEQMSVDELPDLSRLPAWMRGRLPTGPPDEA